MSAIPGNVIIMFWSLMYYVPLINLCPLSRSMCLTIEQCSCDKFVDSELASEAENALSSLVFFATWTSKSSQWRI